MQRFTKWNRSHPNLEVGDIVCLKGERLSPMKWPLVRIIEVEPGKDGKVHVVTVKTPRGTYKRPVTKIIPLLKDSESD